ncbi:MAG: hypothetical protein NXI24_21150 [bacterium]|nr:hypothetical protein [bacterium]
MRASAKASRLGPALKFHLFALVLMLLCPVGSGLVAEVIYLKNGAVIAGKVIGQTRATMRIQTATGVRTIQKTTIRRVSYSAAEEQRVVRQQAEARRQREAEAARKAEAERAAREEAARRAEAEANANDANDTNETDGTPGDITPGGYVWRSAVLPGWGHLAMGKTWTGAAYMGLGGLAIINVFASRSGALGAESQNADDVLFNFVLTYAPDGLGVAERIGTSLFLNSQAQGPYRQAINRYEQSLGLLGAVYLIQLGHIIYDAYLGAAADEAEAAAYRAGYRQPAAGWHFDLAPQAMESDRSARTPDSALEWRGRLEYTFSF